MTIARLDAHDVIALDFDGTLFESGKAKLLAEYVEALHHKKKFYIVTFRSGAWLEDVFKDLRNQNTHYGLPILTPEMFAGVIGFDHNDFQRFTIDDGRRRHGELEGHPTPAEIKWYYHKGQVCKDIGATVLVDDMPAAVIHGCIWHGVEFVFTDSL